MKMRLITSLLVLCLIFSIGSALAQTNVSAGTIPYKEGVILISGNVTGNVTIDGEENSYTGPMLIIRDTNKNTETIRLHGKLGNVPNSDVTASGNLTPLMVNTKQAKSQNQEMLAGPFGLMLAEDFNCNMTNMDSITGGKVDFDLTGDQIGVFGPFSDIKKLQDSTTNITQCNMTQVVTFPVSV